MIGAAARLSLVAALAVGSGLADEGRIVRVTIADLAFSPIEVRARVGDSIEWVNKDLFDHTATMPETEVVIAAGATQRLTFERAGAIDYICRFHPDMKGRITVAPR